MSEADPGDHSDAVRALYGVAGVCQDAALRGAVLALASMSEGVEFAEAVRIWGVAPDRLRALAACLDKKGVEGVRHAVLGSRPETPATDGTRHRQAPR